MCSFKFLMFSLSVYLSERSGIEVWRRVQLGTFLSRNVHRPNGAGGGRVAPTTLLIKIVCQALGQGSGPGKKQDKYSTNF